MPTPPFVDPWLPAADESGSVPTARPATPIGVYRITGSAPGSYSYAALPSVRCMVVEEYEGPAPASAMFRYAFDGRDLSSPQSIEQALSTAFTGTQVVVEGDRLGVLATQPDGTGVWIFDGVCLTWTARLDGDSEQAVIHAVSVAKRAWDTPVAGQTMRTSWNPELVSDVPTDLPAQFNPRGVPNCSPSTGDSGTFPSTYPVFLDPNVTGTDGSSIPYPRDWTLNGGAAYLLFQPMARGGNLEEPFVQNPARSTLDSVLLSYQPISGTPFDPTNSSSYTTAPIIVSDRPLSGRNWPVLIHEFVGDYGFGMRFKLTTASGDPVTQLALWYRQAAAAKPILLQARGSQFDPQWTNLGAAHLTRDLTPVVNRWVVRGGLNRYEASFILAPGFPSNAADATSLSQFDNTDPAFATSANFSAYRLFVLDEDGTGHYVPGSATKVSGTATSLDAVLGAPTGSPAVAQYIKKQRKVIGQLFSVDDQGKYLHARLSYSMTYAGASPGVWDGTATDWQHIPGGWAHLPDRIGIRVDITNPNKWQVGSTPAILKTVEAMNSAGSLTPFFLRLTCVIEGDQGLAAVADLSSMSPLSWPITREVDARDRYSVYTLHGPSEFRAGSTDQVMRNDTIAATAEAIALRTQSEAGVMHADPVVIPRFTAYYEIGDRISSIQGRGLGLRTDSAGAGYAPVYPVVVSRRWELDGGQKTILTLSDSGLNRTKYATKQAGPRDHRAPGPLESGGHLAYRPSKVGLS